MSGAAGYDPERLIVMGQEVLAAHRPAEALCLRLDALAFETDAAAPALAVALFESTFYQLAPFAEDWLPVLATAAYVRVGNDEIAALLAALAVQLQPASRVALPAYRVLHHHFRATDRDEEADAVALRLHALFPDAQAALPVRPRHVSDLAAEAERIVASRAPDELLLAALERLERVGDWPCSARLFEAVWHRLAPLANYWLYFRMMRVYAALGRPDASALLAALTVQVEPDAPSAREAFQRLFRRFHAAGRSHDGAVLRARYAQIGPDEPLLDAAEATQTGALAQVALPPRTGRRDHAVVPAEMRPAQTWTHYGNGVPAGLGELRGIMTRRALRIAELRDAEVLTWDDAVAVFSADGTPQLDLSVRCFPALLRRQMDRRRDYGFAEEGVTLDEAALANDQFPPPNVCHFLADHATRVAAYRRVGVDLSRLTVIGPPLRTEYQRETIGRLGVGAWRSTSPPARLRVRRLWVCSNCRHLQHPAHWGADWAVASVRALFDVAPRSPSRRLLLSRADMTYRRIANEPELAELLCARGFEVLVPGRLPFAEQIAAFRDASHIVGPHGGAFGNLLFCAPGTHVLETFHPQYGTWAYAMLAAPLGLDYASLVGTDAQDASAPEFNDPAWPLAQRNDHSDRDMRVDVTELRRWLDASGA
jgi:capsular polysaccharide biosynthesis protein